MHAQGAGRCVEHRLLSLTFVFLYPSPLYSYRLNPLLTLLFLSQAPLLTLSTTLRIDIRIDPPAPRRIRGHLRGSTAARM